ncbi:hypothetical protein H6F89_01630 [Cyanobacteria bacterium FACHB-63]|nr:hypothetical protein [Cyanobacteria bacterium FACHB-63]
MNQEFNIGDRVVTPTGKTGCVIESDADFPLHCLIAFDSGEKRYILRRILQPAIEARHQEKSALRAIVCFITDRISITFVFAMLSSTLEFNFDVNSRVYVGVRHCFVFINL